jgi:hypothetical protein
MRLTGLSFALLFVVGALAQTNSSTTTTTGVLGGMIPAPSGAASNTGLFFSSIGPGMPGGTITGAPYSAEGVTEHVQTLADGTHITQPTQKTKFYRDSLGRTRTEHSFPVPPGALANGADAPSLIEISDPVAGVHYTLEPRNHTARKMSVPPPPPLPSPNSANISTGRFVRSSAIVVAQSASASGNGAAAAARAVVPAPGPSSPESQRPQFSRESLGTQTIEGVLVDGSRTTVTYPIGSVGNDRPITTSTETWTSSELKVTVLSKNSDPRRGESTTRLTNISRVEPDASLFQVPADYEVIEPQTSGLVR